MRRLVGIGCLIIILGLAGCAEQPTGRFTNKYDDADMKIVEGTIEAIKVYEGGNYNLGYEKLKPFAESGYSVAEFSMGRLYEEGKAVKQDYAEARKWYQLAADQGIVDAQMRIAYFYALGLGVPANAEKAYERYTLAAYQADPRAIFALGLIHEDADSAPNHKLKAYQFYFLTQCYLQAYWPDKVKPATTAIQRREAIAKGMTEVEKAEAYELAKAWAKAHPSPPVRRLETGVGPGPLGTSRFLSENSECRDL